MFADSQSIVVGVAALFLVPLALGWLLSHWCSRRAAALIAAALLGAAALYFGPKPALLAAVWGFALGWLGASDDFMRLPGVDELAREARSGRRRWWEFFGG